MGKINKTHRKPREPFFRSVLAMTLTVKCVCVCLFIWEMVRFNRPYTHSKENIFKYSLGLFVSVCSTHSLLSENETNKSLYWNDSALSMSEFGIGLYSFDPPHTLTKHTHIALSPFHFSVIVDVVVFYGYLLFPFIGYAKAKAKWKKKHQKLSHTPAHPSNEKRRIFLAFAKIQYTIFAGEFSVLCFFFCVGRKIDRATENIRGFLSTQSNLTLVFVACLTVFSTPRRA